MECLVVVILGGVGILIGLDDDGRNEVRTKEGVDEINHKDSLGIANVLIIYARDHVMGGQAGHYACESTHQQRNIGCFDKSGDDGDLQRTRQYTHVDVVEGDETVDDAAHCNAAHNAGREGEVHIEQGIRFETIGVGVQDEVEEGENEAGTDEGPDRRQVINVVDILFLDGMEAMVEQEKGDAKACTKHENPAALEIIVDEVEAGAVFVQDQKVEVVAEVEAHIEDNGRDKCVQYADFADNAGQCHQQRNGAEGGDPHKAQGHIADSLLGGVLQQWHIGIGSEGAGIKAFNEHIKPELLQHGAHLDVDEADHQSDEQALLDAEPVVDQQQPEPQHSQNVSEDVLEATHGGDSVAEAGEEAVDQQHQDLEAHHEEETGLAVVLVVVVFGLWFHLLIILLGLLINFNTALISCFNSKKNPIYYLLAL